ncbi:putative bifunctional diguanylate cyclase/phosphodiesterase [Ruminococcus albus]|uniref:Stage 0 sporulation protein A homolog n=1 Tax=Ruminococcus albus TaxID=1264 RepID=A0A1I1CYR2_RUMAL|nr:EAL domain-containing response regulator [Ruminococcus albus]SFB67791.1 diguanylate cyclase (GGDEF) domain-containing protein [Ruminococcus albus]
MIRSKNIQRPQKVLIVDDQEINRDALEVIMENDYDIIFAENGAQALALMRRHKNELSVVMLDLIMPVMDGYEVLVTIQDDEELRGIPVIVMTSYEEAELEALRLGAADFITKPFDVHEVILARVARIIELFEGRRLISSAEKDGLTGLYSRNFFYEYAERLYRYHPELKMEAIVLNIDRFHTLNALHGREFGDRALMTLGEIIRDFLREKEGIASRFDADRFAIYCIHCDDHRALLDSFQAKMDEFSPKVRIHLRMGVDERTEDAEPVILFDRARTACIMARSDFHNPLRIYNEDILKKELFDQKLLGDLRHALADGQFRVYYQPKYDIRCEPPRLRSAEALVRWEHPDLGMISPGTFIPLFEGNGLITLVDNYVWEETAKQVAKWRKKFSVTLPVSVNISRADIFDPDLTERLCRLITENDLDYRDIKLEVTESAYSQDADRLLNLIHSLREIGFEIEMDDFGAGYSSLNMLSSMPIDVLKMDMSFVRNIEKSETDLRLMKLILDIAGNLKLSVVAEGVETEGQLKLLRDADCDLVQGYYFSRPVPANEFEVFIEKERERSVG